jgi:hypothetical protein
LLKLLLVRLLVGLLASQSFLPLAEALCFGPLPEGLLVLLWPVQRVVLLVLI